MEFLLDIIPTSVIGAFADNVLLQVLFFAVLFGLALAKFGEHGPPVVFDRHRARQSACSSPSSAG